MSEGLIYKQIPKIMCKVGAVEKNRQGAGINYKFRGIDDLTSALQGLLSEHGVFFTPKVLEITREERQSKSGGALTITVLKMLYTFYAEDGSSVEVSTVGEAMDTSDKSANKAMSAALKYALLELFCIPTEDEKDTEYQNHEPQSSHHNPPGSININRYDGVTGKASKLVTEAQLKRLFAISESVGMPSDVIKARLHVLGVKSSQYLNMQQYEELIDWIQNGK